MSFVRALRDPAGPPPSGIAPAHRFKVYRNSVASGLIQALTVRYPRVRAEAGDEAFVAMAMAYAGKTLPNSPVLIGYGETFADTIAEHMPAGHLPWLADLARLESAWWKAYHAAEARPVEREALASLGPEALGALRPVFHPSLQLLRLRHDVLPVWQGDSRAADAAGTYTLVVARPRAEVEVTPVKAETMLLISRLADGFSLADAAEAMMAEFPSAELQDPLRELVSLSVITGLNRENTA
jgi:hypothetical protein